MKNASKIDSLRARRGVLLLAGAGLAMWVVCLTKTPPVDSARTRQQPAPALTALTKQNVDSFEATRRRLASEWQSTFIEQDSRDGQVAERFLDSAHLLHAARAMYSRNQLQASEYERIAADPAELALVKTLAVDADEAERVFGPDQAFVRVYAVRTLVHASKQHPELAAVAVSTLGQKLNQSQSWKKGIERDYVELLAAYARNLGAAAILSDPEAFMKQAQLTPRTSLEFSRALWDSGVLAALSPAQLATLKTTYERLSTRG